MTDIQILTLSLTLLGIFAASWFNNSRVGDIKDLVRSEINGVRLEIGTVRAEMKVMQGELEKQISASEQRVERQIASIDRRLEKMDENILRMLGDHETRITKIEGKQ